MTRPPPPAKGAPMQHALPRLAKDGPEHRAIEAGEIDAIVDHASSNVILLPAARRARELAGLAAGATPASEASVANQLLAALPHAEYQQLHRGLERVTLKSRAVLHEPGAPILEVYFPIDCVVCLMASVETGQVLEVGLVGHEGMVGISLVLGVEISSVRALVQAGGAAMRMKAARFQKALSCCLPLQRALYRYAYAKLALARQSAACSRFHALEARLARCLLMTGERVPSEEFFLTQAFLADMLGVRRATVNQAATALQQRHLIGYRRGHVRILDRAGLEAAACRCYTRIEGAQVAA